MKLVNGTTVIAKPYQDEDAEEIVSLIIRNFREINVKDYGEKAIGTLVATHDVKWFKVWQNTQMCMYFGMKIKLWGLVPYQVFGEVLQKVYY